MAQLISGSTKAEKDLEVGSTWNNTHGFQHYYPDKIHSTASQKGYIENDLVNAGGAEAITRGDTNSWKSPGPPPDGGWAAWTQAIMSHLVVFSTWGYISSFGVFQTYYVTALHRAPSDISWIGSLQTFLLFFIGAFS